MRGDSGVAGEGRVVGVPTFHSWGKCTMPLTNINSDWMSNAFICIILRGSFKVAENPALSRSTNLESKLIDFFVLLNF